MTKTPGFAVELHAGAPGAVPAGALEIEVGSALPVAFTGLRRIVRALGSVAPKTVAAAAAANAPEWAWLVPTAEPAGADLLGIADAPNQRRLFRESEQVYRVLNAGARLLLQSTRELGRPLVLRGAGGCDLVSLRGLMHAVEASRLAGVPGHLLLCDWRGTHAATTPRFHATREAQRARIAQRMRAGICVDMTSGPAPISTRTEPSLEGRYLAALGDERASAEERIAAALLAIRACFFSTNHEATVLAAETGLRVLTAAGMHLDRGALERAWDHLADDRFTVPMLELDRTNLRDAHHVRAQLEIHLGVTCAFTGETEAALAAFTRGLADRHLAPEDAADLHMYRAVALAKRLGRRDEARAAIAAGLAVLGPTPSAAGSLRAAWLHNLAALTCVQSRDLPGARAEEELALACVDHVPGDSATHLKTNLISNYSVLAEAEGDFAGAIRIWRLFEPLNARLGSANADKVHAFRLATLTYLAGDVDGAIAAFERAASAAAATGDLYNGSTIAAALGRIHLARADRAGAARWYERARADAVAAGDCDAAARAYAGAALASDAPDFTAARACLAADSTFDAAGSAFGGVLATGEPATVLAALPLPRSKMTRPFELVTP